jgi:hypothetical protein
MKKLLALSGVIVLVVFVVSSCTVTVTLGSNVSGTITFNNLFVPTPAVVSIQRGPTYYSASVYVPGPVGNSQTGTFSIPGVSSGTYTYAVSFSSPRSSYTIASYVINGGAALPLAISGTYNPVFGDYDWTATIYGVYIQADETIDTYVQY